MLIFGATMVGAAFMTSLSSWLQDRRLTKRMHLDWERQDVVAQRLYADNAKVAQVAAETSGKLDVIHGLVNSNLTQEMKGKRDLAVVNLALLKEVVELKKRTGITPTDASLRAIDMTTAMVAELNAILTARGITNNHDGG
jgi:hypothetical protein